MYTMILAIMMAPDVDPDLLERCVINGEDANILMQIGRIMQQNDPTFVSAVLSNDGKQICFLNEKDADWSRTLPSEIRL